MKKQMTERFEMRLGAATLEDLDAWRTHQDDIPSRAEAVRRLIEIGLVTCKPKRLELAAGDKLILLMLRDLYKHLKLKDGEINPDFISEIIFGGHSWALEWEMTGVFHGHEDKKEVVSEVVDILSMWSFLEVSYENLSQNDRSRLAEEVPYLGDKVRLIGFDGNDESDHLHVALFLIKHLGRFTEFKDRDLNAHMSTLDGHRRMLASYEEIQKNNVGRTLNVNEIIEILSARRVRKVASATDA